jgi:succinoglycan biosynthesis protein ExoM
MQGGPMATNGFDCSPLSSKSDLEGNSPNVLSNEAHITVCICTYKRPELLERLLRELNLQDTDDLFTYSIVVADNDRLRSAKNVVTNFSAVSPVPITYCVVSEQNISLTRNKAIENARGGFVAFIDDDEFPIKRWLVTLYEACKKYGVEGVLGPVKRHFDEPPPKWLMDSKFYDRKTYPTGTAVDRKEGRTGNVLLKRSILADLVPVFRPEFRGGEDTDFFRRLDEKGCRFIWSDEAVAYEVIPPARWKRSFLLKRALLRGATALNYLDFGARDIGKSLVAVPVYTMGLPFALILGQHRFMNLLVRLCDHLGKLLAVVGINPIKEHYITE